MPKVQYKAFNFRTATFALIAQCNSIIHEYQQDNLKLTLRQLYYQLVIRNVIANSSQEYNKLGNTVNDARLAGYIDWDSIEDRTRNLASIGHWESPSDIINTCANSFRIDKWSEQQVRCEVWIEKEALAGVFQRICKTLDVPYLSCRGYMSQSEMWAAAMRFVHYIKAGQRVQIFHFGDHDPSGIDMTRDIQDRLQMFAAHHIGAAKATAMLNIERIALNMDQVRQYDPPENPAKTTDTRFTNYEAEFGTSCWELDALNPRVLAALVRDNIKDVREPVLWQQQVEEEAGHRAFLRIISDNWDSVQARVEDDFEGEIKEVCNSQITSYNAEVDGDDEE